MVMDRDLLRMQEANVLDLLPRSGRRGVDKHHLWARIRWERKTQHCRSLREVENTLRRLDRRGLVATHVDESHGWYKRKLYTYNLPW